MPTDAFQIHQTIANSPKSGSNNCSFSLQSECLFSPRNFKALLTLGSAAARIEMWLHLPQTKCQKHMRDRLTHSRHAQPTPTTASTLSETTPKALVRGQENRRSRSTKPLTSLTYPDQCPKDRHGQMQCHDGKLCQLSE